MKKILAILFLVVLAASCSTPPTDQEATDNSTTPPPAEPAAPPSEAEMEAQERAAWDTLKNKDWVAFADMRASEYTEITAEGVHDKASVLASVKDVNVTDVTLSDWKSLPIDKDAFIATYTVSRTGTFKGFPIPSSPFRASTGWARRDGKWVALYHQETAVAQPGQAPPPPPAGQNP